MTLFTNLGTLESAGLIQVSKIEPDLEYLFRHSLVQDAAYASLLESDRKRLHLAVGEAIERLYPERKHEFAAILAHHFKEADQGDRALEYFIIAGDEALKVYANQEAEIQYKQALELQYCSGTYIAWIYSGLGEALYRQSRFDESLAAFRSGIDIYQSLGDVDGAARLYARSARVKWYEGDRPDGLRICLEGMALVQDSPDGQGKVSLVHETARAYYFNGSSEQALPLCRQAILMAQQLEATNLEADALATLGILAGVSAEESLAALNKSIDIAEAKGLYQVAVRAHVNIGSMIRGWSADNTSSMKHFHRAAELGRMRGVASEELIGLSSYIGGLFSTGPLDEIEAALPHLEDLINQLANPAPMKVLIKYLKAVLRSHQGDWDEPLDIFWQCLDEYRLQQNQESILNMMDEITWVILEKNRWGEPADLDQVDELLQEASHIVEKESMSEWQSVYPRLSMLRARQGRIPEARQWLEKSLHELSLTHSAWQERITAEGEMEIAVAGRDWDRALVEVERLTKFDQRFGYDTGAARCSLCWADLYIRRGKPGDLESAEVLLRQVIADCHRTGVGHYPEIAQAKLKTIQSIVHNQAVTHEEMTRELKKARQVQESLLPENPPKLPGWSLDVILKPAHETSGDFYDFLALPDGLQGMVIADVTDKGTSAALYMALSRSLWRTFAINHPVQPELTMAETNQRILADTHGGLYVTLFYGILDPASGQYTYCNAGHHPALLLRAHDGSVGQLRRTGMPLGVFEDTGWDQGQVSIEYGDTLILFTDGITDAQNSAEEQFGMERLLEAVKRQHGKPAHAFRDGLLAEVSAWVGESPQFDDITLMVLVREKVSA